MDSRNTVVDDTVGVVDNFSMCLNNWIPDPIEKLPMVPSRFLSSVRKKFLLNHRRWKRLEVGYKSQAHGWPLPETCYSFFSVWKEASFRKSVELKVLLSRWILSSGWKMTTWLNFSKCLRGYLNLFSRILSKEKIQKFLCSYGILLPRLIPPLGIKCPTKEQRSYLGKDPHSIAFSSPSFAANP